MLSLQIVASVIGCSSQSTMAPCIRMDCSQYLKSSANHINALWIAQKHSE